MSNISIDTTDHIIRLDEQCWVCKAIEEGKTPNAKDLSGFKNADGVCDVCKGVGYTLTEAGLSFMQFIKRHV